eukprot:4116512-Pyramimonas_sp.AAC.2
MLLCEYSPRGGAVAGMLGRAGTEECGICELVRRGLGLTREESIDFGLREGAVLLYRPVRISLNPFDFAGKPQGFHPAAKFILTVGR